MSVPGFPPKVATITLVVFSGLIPVMVWTWLVLGHGTSAILADQKLLLQNLVETKVALVQGTMNKRLADVRLLALTAPSFETVTPPPPPPEPCETRDGTPPPAPPESIGETARVTDVAGPLRDKVTALLHQFIQDQLKPVKTLASDSQLPMKLVGIDWVFRNHKRKAGGEKWQQFAKTFTPALDAFVQANAYDDLYLISARGDIVYTTTRGPELGANVDEAPLKGSGLQRLFSQASKQVTLEDISPYGVGDVKPAAFSGAPIVHEGRVVGILALRFDLSSRLQHYFAPHALPFALIAADGAIRYNDAAWTQLPAAVQALQSLPQTIRATAQGVMVPDNSGFQVAWDHVQTNSLDWTVLASAPLPEAPPEQTTPPKPAPLCQSVAPPAPPVVTPSPVNATPSKDYLAITGYYDLFLIRPDGLVTHTARGQEDLGTNLLNGPYANTNLGQLVQKVLTTKKPQASDIAPYPPSRNEPAAFLAAPVLVDGQVVRVVALQRPLEEMTELLNPGSLLGPSGDVVLVGEDFRMRSDSFLTPRTHGVSASFQGTIADNGMDIPPVRQALSGERGVTTLSDANGKRRLVAFAPVPSAATTWALLASRDLPPTTESLFKNAAWTWKALAIATLIWFALSALMLTLLQGRPWKKLALVTGKLAKGRAEDLPHQDWETWRDSLEPLHQVVERCFHLRGKLSARYLKLAEKWAQITRLVTNSSAQLPTKGLALESLPDSTGAVLDALARWQQLPAPLPPEAILKEIDAIGLKLTSQLTEIQEIANQVALLANSTTNRPSRTFAKKFTVAESLAMIHTSANKVQDLCRAGLETSLTWRKGVLRAHQGPKIDDILATLLKRIENLLKVQSRLIKSHENSDLVVGDDLRHLVAEMTQQLDKLWQTIESLPRKEPPLHDTPGPQES
ncbi:MAG: cache domain-containing protein [Magnetococcales bacterium]|nr:cache domain-containing protein [Magnetococcales bacterium]